MAKDPLPVQFLRESAETYLERNKLYGNNYKTFGHVMKAMFPNGLPIAKADDWNRVGVFVQIIAKITRYAEQFENGGHDDSLVDIATYSAMLRELDADPQDLDAASGEDQF